MYHVALFNANNSGLGAPEKSALAARQIPRGTPAAAATKTDAVVPSDAPAVEEATALANRTQAALSPDTPGPSVAEEGTTERSTDE